MSDSGLSQGTAFIILGLIITMGIAILEFNYNDRWQFQKKVFSFIVSVILIYITLFVVTFIVMSPGCVIGKSIIVQPFEVSNESRHEISGKHLSNSLCFELTRIGKVKHDSDRLGYTNVIRSFPRTSNNASMPSASTGNRRGTLDPMPTTETKTWMPSVTTSSGPSSLKEYDSYQVGKVEISGVSLSVDQIIPFLKKLTHNQGGLITSSFQRHGSTLCIVSNYYDPDSQGRKDSAWKVSRKLKENESVDDVIPSMVEDLAYKIELDIARDYNKAETNNYPQTWEAYKNLTLGWEAYHLYNSTRDNDDLEIAERMALSAKSSEPYFLESDELLSNLEWIWNSKGLALTNLDEYDAALRCFEKVIEIDKNITAINHQAESA